MRIDEVADRLRGEHHDADGDDDREHHHRDVVDHAHRRDHGIERKHDVDDRDLDQRADETGLDAMLRHAPSASAPSSALMDLEHRLGEQEKPATEQDQVPAGEIPGS